MERAVGRVTGGDHFRECGPERSHGLKSVGCQASLGCIPLAETKWPISTNGQAAIWRTTSDGGTG